MVNYGGEQISALDNTTTYVNGKQRLLIIEQDTIY